MAIRLVFFFMLFACVSFGQSNLDSSEVVLSRKVNDVEITANVIQNAKVISLSRKQFLSMAGALEDPTRLLIKFPGISTANDQANSVIYRGMPAQFHRWSLYGARILNPNHLGNAGTISDFPSRSAGGVNMMSGQVIGSLDFSGNTSGNHLDALSGSSNMKLRDPYENGVSTNLSLIGLEAGLDRVSSDGKGSLLLNYRYSTVGLLTSLGLDFGGEVINYQDLAGKYSRKVSNRKTLSFYFAAGLNSNEKEGDLMGEEFEDLFTVDFDSKNFVFGINGDFNGEDRIGSSTINFSYNSVSRISNNTTTPQTDISLSDYSNNEYLISTRQDYKVLKGNWTFGGTTDVYFHSIDLGKEYPNKEENALISDVFERKALNSIVTLNSTYQASPRWLFTGKIGAQYVTSKEKDLFAFVGHFQIDYTHRGFYSNLSLSRASQVFQPEVMIYGINSDFSLSNNVEYKINYKGIGFTAFYHNLTNIPVSTVNYGFSGMENLDILPLEKDNGPVILSSDGMTDIYGVTLTYSKSFAGFQFFSNITLSDSKHDIGDGNETKAPLDYGHVLNASLSKSWNIGKSKQFGISATFHHRGGARQNDVDLSSPFNWGYTNFSFENQYNLRLADYHRMDLRILYKPSKRSTISLDIQNVLNRENEVFYAFNPLSGSPELNRQLGMIPILAWRVNW